MYQKFIQISLFATLLVVSISVKLLGQPKDYQFTSTEDFGQWTDDATWTKNNPNYPNYNSPKVDGGSGNDSEIIGYVRREGDLLLDNGTQIMVRNGGILWIAGNFTLTGGAEIYVEPGGLLVVDGNIDMINGGGKDSFVNGVMVVTGDANIADERIARNFQQRSGGDAYVYNTTTVEGNDVSPLVPDRSALQTDHPDIYAFIEGGGPLPITLRSFVGYTTSQGVVLEWVTETEENFDFFTVERAGADVQFEPIAIIKGKGGVAQVTGYNFIDEDQLAGVFYYRLKATDFDGSEEYHKVIAVMVEETGKKEQLTAIFPNPVMDKRIYVQSRSAANQLQLINYQGTAVLQLALQVGRHGYELPRHLPTGYYTAVIIDNQGKKEQQRVIIR